MAYQATDILIVGAGPGGCMAALFLAKQGIPSILLDKATFPRDKICGDALSGKVVEVLKKYNPDLVQELQAQPFALDSWGVTFVAPNLQSLNLPFLSTKKMEHAPGFLAKRLDFDHFLVQQVKQQPLIQLMENCEYKKIIPQQDGIRLELSNGTSILTRLLIAADGAYSLATKQLANIRMEPKHYCAGLRAYYKNVKNLDPQNYIELIFLKEFLPGYLWIFPLANGEANVGVGMRSDVLRKKKLDLKKAMMETLHNHPFLKDRFKDAELIGKIHGYGLPLASKKRVLSGDRFLLVGDAASLIDPFTGEGIGNAMLSAMFAAQTAIEALQQHNFSTQFLKTYDRKVYERLGAELKTSTILQKLVNYPWLFNWVVKRANNSPTLKNTISAMFEDINLRKQFKNPLFYLKLLFN